MSSADHTRLERLFNWYKACLSLQHDLLRRSYLLSSTSLLLVGDAQDEMDRLKTFAQDVSQGIESVSLDAYVKRTFRPRSQGHLTSAVVRTRQP